MIHIAWQSGKRRFVEPLEPRLFLCAEHAHEDISPAPAPGANVASGAIEPASVSSLNFATLAASPISRDEAAGAAIKGNKLFVFGGFHNGTWTATTRVDRFDNLTNTWTQMRDMPEALTHVATVVQGQRVWLIGGYAGDNPGPSFRSVWIYDTRTDRYKRGPSLPEPRGAGAAAQVGNTLVYFGGSDRNSAGVGIDKGTTWTLDLNRQDLGWTRVRKMPNARNHIAAATIGGTVYAIGGQSNYAENATTLSLVHRYNPKHNRWTQVASLPETRSHTLASTVVYGGSILAVGGERSHNDSRESIYRYDASRNVWSTFATLPRGRRSPIAGLLGSTLVVTAGSYDNGAQTADTIRTQLPTQL